METIDNNVTQFVAFGTAIGRSQAFGAMTYKCSVEQAKALEQVWESGAYKLLGLTWEKYCLEYAGLSHQRVEGIIRNRQEFGDIYLRLSDIIAISPETYRHIQPKVHADAIEIAGEMVPVIPENAARIREAVNRLRAQLRKAQEGVDRPPHFTRNRRPANPHGRLARRPPPHRPPPGGCCVARPRPIFHPPPPANLPRVSKRQIYLSSASVKSLIRGSAFRQNDKYIC